MPFSPIAAAAHPSESLLCFRSSVLNFIRQTCPMTPLHVMACGETGLAPLGQADSLDQLSHLIAQRTESCVALSPTGEVDRRVIDETIAVMRKQRSQIAIAPLEERSQWDWLVNEVGAALTCCILSPERSLVVLDSELARKEQRLRPVSHPIWDLILSAITRGTVPLVQTSADVPNETQWLTELVAPLPPLVPNSPRRQLDWLNAHLQSLPLELILGKPRSQTEFMAIRAGLLQLHNFLDDSHKYSQQIEHEGRDRNGDYWHAIMHRREPDYSNSKYWFRSVGGHPIFSRLAKLADVALIDSGDPAAGLWQKRLALPSHWDPFAFVDLCQSAELDLDSALTQAARRIQRAEQLLLIAHTVATARSN